MDLCDLQQSQPPLVLDQRPTLYVRPRLVRHLHEELLLVREAELEDAKVYPGPDVVHVADEAELSTLTLELF